MEGPTGPTLPNLAQMPLGEMFSLELGSSTMVDGHMLRFDHITEDSRCPSDVDCVWEGRATVSLSFITGGEMENVQMSIPGFVGMDSEPRDLQRATVQVYTLELLQLDPYPQVESREVGDVQLGTFRVTLSG